VAAPQLSSMTQQPRAWPALREDLTLHEGSPDATGAPSWTLHDPARNQYFSIDWTAFQVISRLVLGNATAVAASIRSETTLIHLDEDDVWAVIQFLEDNELVQRHSAQSSSWLKSKRETRKSGFWQGLVHN
jgi:putative peptide zinc metalloprotease protein